MKENLLKRITDNSALIDNAISFYIPKSNLPYETVKEAARYSALGGGKRIRPFLTLEFARLFGGTTEGALPYAVALELIHTYSLIHDDLPCMDNSDVRRDRPSCHIKFGEAKALLAGDLLLTKAFGIAASNDHQNSALNAEAVALLSSLSGYDGMIGGQMLDLIGETEKLTYEHFLMMNTLKTGCLIKCACLLGALSAGYRKGTAEYGAAEKYAECVGLAFQIEDDILDIETDTCKTTFLSFMTQEQARNKIQELTSEASNAISSYKNSEILKEFSLFLSLRTV